jgi:hypothetical protein
MEWQLLLSARRHRTIPLLVLISQLSEPNKGYRILHGNECSQVLMSSHIALTHREARYYEASLKSLPDVGHSSARNSMTGQSEMRKSNVTADHRTNTLIAR